MRILPSEAVQFAPDDVIFRQSVQAPLAATVGSLLAATGVFTAVWKEILPWPLAALAGIFLVLFSALSAVSLRRALSPTNWLLACDRRRVLIKLRSYLNAGFPEVPHVLELPLTEIEAARETRLDLVGRDHLNERANQSVVFLDLQLRVEADLTQLEERLRHERQLRGGGTAWRHYPVSVIDERTLRIEWRGKHARTVPGVAEALHLLGRAVRTEAGKREHVDLGAVGRRPDGAEILGQVRSLAVQGRVLEATLLAKRAFGWSTTEAKQFVEQVSGSGGAA